MFRKIALFLTLVLVIGALSACAAPGELQTRDLTERQKEQILKSYTTSFDELRWGVEDDSYYGNYDGYDIFLITEKRFHRGGSGIRVDQEILRHRKHSFEIYGYRDGKFETLSELVGAGKISSDSLKALVQINNIGNPQNLPVLAHSLKAEVEKAWSAHFLAENKDVEACWEDSGDFNCNTNFVFSYFCSVEGYDVFWCNGAIRPAMASSVTIGEYIFRTGYPCDLYAYKNGGIQQLSDLYEDGEVREESVAALYEKYMGDRKSLTK